MKKSGKYATGSTEDQYEPGSRNTVLKNLRGIKNKKEIERIETRELLRATEVLVNRYTSEHVFTADDICLMHKEWLSSLYGWAGNYRQVLISKSGFSFAAPAFIHDLMGDFERKILKQYTPCIFDQQATVIKALAIVHTEILLIHPFREGNGRIARLLAVCMGFQAGLPFLDFSDFEGRRRESYFAAVRAGLDRNYEPMGRIFTGVVSRSLQNEQ